MTLRLFLLVGQSSSKLWLHLTDSERKSLVADMVGHVVALFAACGLVHVLQVLIPKTFGRSVGQVPRDL